MSTKPFYQHHLTLMLTLPIFGLVYTIFTYICCKITASIVLLRVAGMRMRGWSTSDTIVGSEEEGILLLDDMVDTRLVYCIAGNCLLWRLWGWEVVGFVLKRVLFKTKCLESHFWGGRTVSGKNLPDCIVNYSTSRLTLRGPTNQLGLKPPHFGRILQTAGRIRIDIFTPILLIYTTTIERCAHFYQILKLLLVGLNNETLFGIE